MYEKKEDIFILCLLAQSHKLFVFRFIFFDKDILFQKKNYLSFVQLCNNPKYNITDSYIFLVGDWLVS